MTYNLHRTPTAPALNLNWQSPAWHAAETLDINHFLPQGTAHRPRTLARVLHDGRALHGIFQVQDQFVRCVRQGYGTEVWKDSCVEFFLEPKPGRGYFNFEFNCGGSFLCNHITDATRITGGLGFQAATRLTAEAMAPVRVATTLPGLTDPEIATPTTWTLQFTIPLSVMEAFIGSLGDASNQIWRGNFYKCADESSHPHWAAWSPVDEFNFHLPRCFGELRLG